MSARLKSKDVFINCPFDSRYKPIFSAIVFSVNDLGFVARCSLEEDAADFRLSKIERMIEECHFGINDLSAVTLDTTDKPTTLQYAPGVGVVSRLQATSTRAELAGGGEIVERYRRFQRDLPAFALN